MRKFYLTGEEMDRLGEDTRKLMEKDKAGCDTRTRICTVIFIRIRQRISDM